MNVVSLLLFLAALSAVRGFVVQNPASSAYMMKPLSPISSGSGSGSVSGSGLAPSSLIQKKGQQERSFTSTALSYGLSRYYGGGYGGGYGGYGGYGMSRYGRGGYGGYYDDFDDYYGGGYGGYGRGNYGRGYGRGYGSGRGYYGGSRSYDDYDDFYGGGYGAWWAMDPTYGRGINVSRNGRSMQENIAWDSGYGRGRLYNGGYGRGGLGYGRDAYYGSSFNYGYPRYGGYGGYGSYDDYYW